MGVSWEYVAEVVTTEPEKVKELILQIAGKDETAGVYDIEIKGNSIFFTSAGYGVYGLDSWDMGCDYDNGLLFARLFEEYAGALICFEAVRPCQEQDYYFSSTWIKPDGIVKSKINSEDDEDYENFYIITREIGLKSDWSISVDELEKYQDEMPNLYATYLKAKADGFDDWKISYEQKKVINYEVADKIGKLYSDGDSDSTLWWDIIEDCNNNVWKLISYPGDADGYSDIFELP
ncbi:MAG: hypothetical protein EAZ87_00705 [Nostocales cyanobacterium]|nr:MAG: hypothetical protein EAZ87_00705 [Nostocales cyanobacterium]